MVDLSASCERVLVILPTYNERQNIEPIVQAIHTHLPQATIWVVDDNSPDGTGQVADSLAETESYLQVIHRTEKAGLGAAYVDAYRRALQEDFDCVVQMDADFSHDPAYLPQLVFALRDADMALGSRYVAGGGTSNWSAVRQAISRGGNIVAQLGLGVRTRDATGGFRAFRRSTLDRLQFDKLCLRGYGFQIEVVFQVEGLGLRICEVPIVFVERAAGTSKMSRDIAFEAMLYIVRRRLETLLAGSLAHPVRARRR